MATVTAIFEADFRPFSASVKEAESEIEAFAATVDSSVVSVDDMAKAMRDMDDPISGLNTEFSEFDSILKLAGVNIGQYNKALGELGSLLGLSASTMALIGPAAAVVGTALAAWELGTLIGEWTGLTDAIANFGTRAETAGAEADAIALAFERTGQEARSGAEALRLNTEWLKANQEQQKKTAEAAAETARILKEHFAQRLASEKEFYAFVDANEVKAEAKRKDRQAAIDKEREQLGAWKDAMTEVMLAEGAWVEVINAMNPALVDRIKNLMESGVSTNALLTAEIATDTQLKAVVRSREFDNQMLREAKTLKDELVPATDDLATALYNEAKAIDAEFEALRRATQAEKEYAEATAATSAATFHAIPIPAGKPGALGTGRLPPSPFIGGTGFGGLSPKAVSQQVVNINGILVSDDPAARQALAQAINLAMMGQLRGGGQQMGRG